MALPGGAICGLWHYHFTVVLCASYRCSLGVFGARYRLRPHHVGVFGRSSWLRNAAVPRLLSPAPGFRVCCSFG